MRRLIALLLLGSMLLACGTPEAAPTPTRQTTASYPTPAEATPSPLPSTPTLAPTVSISETMTPTPHLIEITPVTTTSLTATLVQSIPLDAKQMPTTLVGWSPDERYLLYVQGKETDPATNMELGRLWVLDLATGQPTMIIDDGVVVGHVSGSYVIDANKPQWNSQCCSVIASLLEHGKQVVHLLDVQGKSIKELARPITPSLVQVMEGHIYQVTSNQGKIDSTELKTPLISNGLSITNTVMVENGFFTHNNYDIQYIDTNTSWVMRGNDTFLRNVYPGGRMEIFRMIASPDGTMVAITTALRGTNIRDLWILNRLTNEYLHVDTNDTFAYLQWSQDSRLLAYQGGQWFKVFDIQTDTMLVQPDEYTFAPIWHPTLYRFAVTNEVTQSIDIFDIVLGEK